MFSPASATKSSAIAAPESVDKIRDDAGIVLAGDGGCRREIGGMQVVGSRPKRKRAEKSVPEFVFDSAASGPREFVRVTMDQQRAACCGNGPGYSRRAKEPLDVESRSSTSEGIDHRTSEIAQHVGVVPGVEDIVVARVSNVELDAQVCTYIGAQVCIRAIEIDPIVAEREADEGIACADIE